MLDQLIHEANQVITQRKLRHYLPSVDGANTWTVNGACITARRVARCGIPADAACWRFLVENPDGGWSFTARAVFRNGTLMPPLATHVAVERYFADDENLIPDAAAACVAVNRWLHSL